MWGTIARTVIRIEVPDVYSLAQVNAFDQSRPADIEHVDFYRSSTVPLEVWMLAMSADEESYRSNAESRAQYAGYLTMRASLQRDPEWHDVSQILSFASET